MLWQIRTQYNDCGLRTFRLRQDNHAKFTIWKTAFEKSKIERKHQNKWQKCNYHGRLQERDWICHAGRFNAANFHSERNLPLHCGYEITSEDRWRKRQFSINHDSLPRVKTCCRDIYWQQSNPWIIWWREKANFSGSWTTHQSIFDIFGLANYRPWFNNSSKFDSVAESTCQCRQDSGDNNSSALLLNIFVVWHDHADAWRQHYLSQSCQG